MMVMVMGSARRTALSKHEQTRALSRLLCVSTVSFLWFANCSIVVVVVESFAFLVCPTYQQYPKVFLLLLLLLFVFSRFVVLPDSI